MTATLTRRPSRTPLPTVPPPRRRDPELVVASFPDEGTWVTVTTVDRAVMSGRVVAVDVVHVRLHEGAGFWDIPTGDVVRVQTACGQERCHGDEFRDRDRQRVERILARWP